MDVTLAYPSSLECWKHVIQRNQYAPNRRYNLKQDGSPSASSEELKRLEERGLSLPLHCFCASPYLRRNSQEVICHVAPNGGRNPIFVDVPDIHGLRVSCPEHTLMQACSKMDLIPFLKLCYEFCGTYQITESGIAARQNPLTSVDRCARFATTYASFRGSAVFRQAISHVIDGSASPRETAIALLLTLPTSMGGYGLPKPQLNKKLSFGDRQLSPDFFWKDHSVGIEYDSDQYHANAMRITRDALRKNTFAFADKTIVTLTNRQLQDIREMDAFAANLCRLLGKRFRTRRNDFEQRQYLLRLALLGNY